MGDDLTDRETRLRAMERIIKAPRPTGPKCPVCDGTGRSDTVDPYDAHFNLPCSWCGGTGRTKPTNA